MFAKIILDKLSAWIYKLDGNIIKQNMADDAGRSSVDNIQNDPIIILLNESLLQEHGYFEKALEQKHINLKLPLDLLVSLSSELFVDITEFVEFCSLYTMLLEAPFDAYAKIKDALDLIVVKILKKNPNSIFYFKKIIPLWIKIGEIVDVTEKIAYYMMFAKSINGKEGQSITNNMGTAEGQKNFIKFMYELSDLRTIILEYIIDNYRDIDKLLSDTPKKSIPRHASTKFVGLKTTTVQNSNQDEDKNQTGGSLNNNFNGQDYQKYLKYKTKYLKLQSKRFN